MLNNDPYSIQGMEELEGVYHQIVEQAFALSGSMRMTREMLYMLRIGKCGTSSMSSWTCIMEKVGKAKERAV